jgi:DNA end-binding protein Ku
VQQKVEGEQITLAEEPEGGAQIIDLMEALRASLREARWRGARRRRARGKAASHAQAGQEAMQAEGTRRPSARPPSGRSKDGPSCIRMACATSKNCFACPATPSAR